MKRGARLDIFHFLTGSSGEFGVNVIYGETAEYDSVGLEFLLIRRIQRQFCRPLKLFLAKSCDLIGARL
jgi:hypothetical protein